MIAAFKLLKGSSNSSRRGPPVTLEDKTRIDGLKVWGRGHKLIDISFPLGWLL